ncbi:MAG: hypothetical protein J5I93_15415 [Pirellulaceae bacterium]|nr:hypothetical protein [Pirellulaceae bacterium]
MSLPEQSAQRRLQAAIDAHQYAADAWYFVLQVIPLTSDPTRKSNHVSAADFCWMLHDHALDRFGPRAAETLSGWGVRSTRDFGRIVYGLIDAGLILRSDEDRIEQFDDVFEFDQAFQHRRRPRPSRFRFRLSTLLIVTTTAAVALAGYVRLGWPGAVLSVMTAWLGLIGGVTLYLSFTQKAHAHAHLAAWVIGGICLLAAGASAAIMLASPYWN